MPEPTGKDIDILGKIFLRSHRGGGGSGVAQPLELEQPQQEKKNKKNKKSCYRSLPVNSVWPGVDDLMIASIPQ